ncbi:MAG: helix-turn-helix domain-containing protein [Acutalibacteraceae bacterium]|jgi:AraC-like DNA-binding protein/quercetin dioxygenase-like cupin family protein
MSHTWHNEFLQVPGNTLVKLSVVHLDVDSRVGPHTHHTLELSRIQSGRGEYRVGKAVYPVGPGDMVLFNNMESHGMWNTGDEILVNVALEFEPRFIWSDPILSEDQALLAMFFDRSRNFSHKLDRDNPLFADVSRQFDMIREEFDRRLPAHPAVIKARLVGLLSDLLRHFDLVRPAGERSASPHPDMEQVLNYVSEHFAEPLSLDDLAAIMHVTPSYFCRLFRAANGLSPKEYIVKMRVIEATQRLKYSDADVLDIAQACGFNSLSNFYSAFKRITGKSPAQYRAAPID